MDFEARLAAKRVELGTVTDALGKGIEAGILDTVAVLQLLGFETHASCEGHVNWGAGWPWVDVVAPNEPRFRWEGEEEVRERLKADLGATERDISPGPERDEAKSDAYEEKFWEWVDRERVEESAEYGAWRDAFHREYLRLLRLVRAFDDGQGDLVLALNRMNVWARLEVMDDWSGYDEAFRRGKKVEDPEAEARLGRRQAVMRAFTAYLMEKAREEA